MADRTVFYAWQSQRPDKDNRYLIRDALLEAIAGVNDTIADGFKLGLDQDARGAVGAKEISSALLNKIEACTVFVADVTPVGSLIDGRPTPNPNVVFELGFAWHVHGEDRVVLLFNDAYGKPDELPFDISKRHMVRFRRAPDSDEARATAVKSLARRLREQIAEMLKGDEWAALRNRGATDPDIALFAAVYERALAENGDVMGYEGVLAIGAEQGLGEDEVADATKVLEDAGGWAASGAISPHRYSHIRLTLSGLSWYGLARIPDYTALLNKVGSMVLAGEHWGPAIAEKLERSPMLIDHMLEVLETNGYVRLSRTNGGNQVFEVLAPLRRARTSA